MSLRIDQHSLWGRFLLALGALLAGAVLRLVRLTCRFEVVAGREHLEALGPGPAVLCFWHNRSILAWRHLFDRRWRPALDLLVFASKSRDGELVSRVAKQLRLRVVRGSASRGGREAVRLIYRAIRRDGASPVMIPDGPRGPVYELKVGVVILAQMAQAPILPLSYAASRTWTIRSWDKLIVPRPFAKVVVSVGAPRTIARGLSSEALEAERRSLESTLDVLTLRAENALGVDDAARPHAAAAA